MLCTTPTVRRFSALVLVVFALFAAQAFGSSSDSSARDNQVEAANFVAARLAVWQQRMDLKDWQIRVEVVRSDRLEPKTLGNIHWDSDLKSATIFVLSPEDYKLPHDAMLNDMELTIVHELVHLELASLPRSEASRRVEEHAVNAISSALLKLAPPR
jgi:hypothetical protein